MRKTLGRLGWWMVGSFMLLGCFSGPVPRHTSPNSLPSQEGMVVPPAASTVKKGPIPDPLAPIANPRTVTDKIVNGAKAEARRKVRYDPRYVGIDYPGGDVPADRGACTDVIVRALRHAGYDLQQQIHEDMRRHFRWGLRKPDRNIDHRRVPNQMCFLRRHGATLTREATPVTLAEWQPGNLVYWKLDRGVDHCGVLSNVRNDEGWPLVIHNLSQATQEDCLTAWEITGHFRYPEKKE